jgi:hypothetical protein
MHRSYRTAHSYAFMYTNRLIHPVFLEELGSGQIGLSDASTESATQSSQAAPGAALFCRPFVS